MPYSYVFDFNRREHVRACRQTDRHAIRRRWLRRLTRLAMTVGGIFFAAVAAGQWVQGAYLTAWMFLVWSALLALTPLFSTFVAYGNARQWEKRNAGSRSVTFDIQSDGVSSSSGIGRMEMRWVGITQVVETPEFVLFYITEKMAMYLPKRAISAHDLVAIRDLTRQHVPTVRRESVSRKSLNAVDHRTR
jgi:hypothetical protein